MGGFNQIKKDKLLLSILIIVIIIGIYLRLNNFSEVGYWGDIEDTIPTGLLWFQEHSFYPQLLGQGEPPLGDIIIGASCMLSGQDFSAVSKMTPSYYPDRPALLGNSLAKANTYCHLSMYIFGIVFFIAISILSLMLLGKYSSLFSVSFFAFNPILLKYSRWIHIDIISWAFLALMLIFLYKFYIAPKDSKKEITYLVTGVLFLALAAATKFPTSIYILLVILLILEKYKHELFLILKKLSGYKLEEKISHKRILLLSILSFIIFSTTYLAFFKFNPKNLIEVYKKVTAFSNPNFSKLALNLEFHKSLLDGLLRNINILDTIILILSLYTLYKLIFIKKSEREKFILLLVIIFLISLFFSRSAAIDRIMFTYQLGLIFLMSLFFSRPYSLLSKFSLKKKIIPLTILTIYILFSAQLAFSDSPYFSKRDPIICKLYSLDCEPTYSDRSSKATAEYLTTIIQDNETFFPAGTPTTIYYYLRHEQSQQQYLMEQAFQQKLSRMPTLEELVTFFKPSNRIVRYILTSPKSTWFDIEASLKENYKPNHIIRLNNRESVWIYDLQNLQKK